MLDLFSQPLPEPQPAPERATPPAPANAPEPEASPAPPDVFEAQAGPPPLWSDEPEGSSAAPDALQSQAGPPPLWPDEPEGSSARPDAHEPQAGPPPLWPEEAEAPSALAPEVAPPPSGERAVPPEVRAGVARRVAEPYAGRSPAPPAAASRTYTVSLLNSIVRELLESACPPVWVAGEVTGWKRHSSGHCYFALRDASAQVRCVMWRSDAQRLPADPDEGMEVRVLGTVTVYEKRGEYQLVVRELEGSGRGGLWRLAFERLHAKLTQEGLLAPERKRRLPAFPRVLGVVTSASGAALHDILNVIERRAPWTRVVLCPARVQGQGAAAEVVRALALLGRLRPPQAVDVIIVGRGGGSKDDLWPFNDEALARAIAASPVPVISAVGHETDITIADLVADLRAPTPSAAAEAAVPDGRAVARRLTDTGERLARIMRRRVARLREDAARAGAALEECTDAVVRARLDRLARAAGQLEALSPLSALRRGYAVPLAPDGRVLRRAGDFLPGVRFGLKVVDGSVPCRVERPDGRTDVEPGSGGAGD